MILILEDNAERLQRFAATLHAIDPNLAAHVWRNAFTMIREAGPLLSAATLISLDHDLDAEPGVADPGDGYEVAKWLVSQPFKCPVIIHTSNSERARWMIGVFEQAGWPYWRVAPLGDDWVEIDWRNVVRRLLAPELGS